MKSFSEMGVTLTRRFTGDRIRIEKIEGDEIIVKDYKIEASKMKNQEDPNRCECLYLQLEVKGKDYVTEQEIIVAVNEAYNEVFE